MSQLEVIDRLLTQRKFLLVTGKGGIGKTLVSCALAKRAEMLGKRVLVVEQSAVGQIASLLGFNHVGHEEVWNGKLGAANFTAGGNFKDFISKHLMKSTLLDLITSNKVVHSFFTSIPGFSELMLLGRMYYAVNLEPNYKPDLVIMDSFASGHFLSLMTTPEAVLRSGLAGPIVHQTTKVQNWLRNSDECSTLYVTIPEELVISETLEFLPMLNKKSPSSLGAVVMNRVIKSDEHSDGMTEADLFIDEKIKRQKLALTHYAKASHGDQVLHQLPVWTIPDLGSVDDPLTDECVMKLLKGEA